MKTKWQRLKKSPHYLMRITNKSTEGENLKLKRAISALLAAFCLVCSVNVLALTDEKAAEPIAVTSQCVELKRTEYTYNGEKKKPKPTVTVDGKKLKNGRDYTVKYKNNKAVGKACVTVCGKGEYTGKVNAYFKIIPQKPTKVKTKSKRTTQLAVSWKKVKGADGYEVRYSKTADFKKTVKLTVGKSSSASVRGVNGGKYYVRVRCFKAVNGKRIYSKFTKSETVEVKKGFCKTSKKNVICLTFDDGPSANVTPRVLDTLKKNDTKATFFIVNYTKQNKKLVKRIIDEGHTLGIHCYSHDYSEIYKSKAAFVNYYTKLQKKIKKDFDYDVKAMRFPGGSSNTVSRSYSNGVMTKLTKYMNKHGIAYFDWNVSSEDATAVTASPGTIYTSTVSGLAKKRTNVVLMHDAASKTTTADALQGIIDYGYNNGYVFENITDSTPAVHHAVAN